MKTRFSLFGFIAILLLGIGMYFASCNNNDLNGVVTYKGHVVYLKTTTPFPDLEVKVTNGDKIHVLTHTDGSGDFSLKVKVSEIDGSYYVLVGDTTCVTKKVEMAGYGQAEVDLGTIEIEGPTVPVVITKPVVSVTADAAVCSGEVTSDGRLNITARGVCYSKNAYPTITDDCTKDGTGVGEFTSNLSNLEHNTIYYVRAYATNRMGVAYGEQVKFTTEEGVPIVVTDSVIRITAHSARCKGHVESDGGFPVTKRGTCWSKQPDPTIDDNCTNDGSGLGEFTSALTDLMENTTYYVRTYATNSTSTVYGEQIVITTLDGLAVVKTDSIVNVTATGCTAYGTVVSDCDIPVTARGFCYATTQYPTIENDHTTIGKGLGKFQSTISNLEYGTTYYVRAYATNATETSYGEQFTITTLDGLPTVTTNQVTNIGSVKATCGGNVTSDGSLTVTARGVCYGTAQQPTISGSHTTDGKGLGTFTSNITGLQDKTTYYVRAYATTAAGTSYGEERTFVTANGTPVVVLSSLGTPTATSITCTGNVTGDGGVTVTERGFCYSTSQYPVNTGSHLAIGSGVGEFSGSIVGLTVNTTYYVRAYAVNSLGVGYSEQQSFTTPNGMPTVTTGQATATATTITISGNVTNNGGFAVTERGICYSASNSEPTITDSKVISGQGNGAFNLSISSLSAATTYYLRAYATNENGTAYGDAVSVTTANGQASVTTGTITSITALTASGKVTVTNAGGATLQTCGICWSTSPNPTISDNTATGGNQLNTAYTCNMSDLTPNTTYYVRGYATTDITTTYGSQVTFQTATGLPELTTSQPTSTATTITAGGEITSNGGYAVTERGICYSTTNSEPTILDSKVACGSGSGSFSTTISTLTANTTYYVRAYATNSIGTNYGESISIITKNGQAAITTGTIISITALTASGKVTVTNTGGATLQTCGICYGTMPNPTITDNTVVGGNQLNTAYTCNMTNLTPNTIYYVRGYATTDITTAYGNQVTFTSATGLPVLTTTDPTATSTTITAGGDITSDGGYNITARGICYSTTTSTPTLSDQFTTAGVGTGVFSSILSGVSASTTYYVRAYATNSIGTGYGDPIAVTTGNGLPVVITTAPTLTDSTVFSGGQITDDGGYPITARGICYGTFPYPDLTSTYMYTTDGNATGYYTSTFSLPMGSGLYYIRAYATNENGTAYGAQYTIVQPYDTLPFFVYDGHTYRVAPIAPNTMTWENANNYCNGLVLYGYSDWRLPTKDELYQMYVRRAEIGGFITNAKYWSSSRNDGSGNYYYCVSFSSGAIDYYYYNTTNYSINEYSVRPIRVEE